MFSTASRTKAAHRAAGAMMRSMMMQMMQRQPSL
jgi:hypothetical protein